MIDAKGQIMSDTSRRSFIALALAMTAASEQRVLAGPRATPTLEQDLASYVGFGEHRVGTIGERKTARWLNGRMEQLGYNSRIEPFIVPTLLNPAGSIRAGAESFTAFPQWMPPPALLNKTLSAPLQFLGAEAGPASLRFVADPIGFTAGWTPALDKMAKEAATKGALALILAINIPSGDLFVCNQHETGPLPLPVALIAKRDLPRLKAQLGAAASLRLNGKSVQANSYNVVARKSGKGQQIVVSTPLTGWFSCGGERGPGIALWLRMAKLLSKSSRPVLMLGTGSHEIGHHGIEHHLGHHALAPNDVALWLHFGASLAATRLDKAAGFTSPQYLVGLADTEARAREAFGKHIQVYVPGSARTQGEAGPIIAGGYRNFIGMSGMFPAFHTPMDRGEAVDFAKLEEIALSAEMLLKGYG
jgi:hypothetical protein